MLSPISLWSSGGKWLHDAVHPLARQCTNPRADADTDRKLEANYHNSSRTGAIYISASRCQQQDTRQISRMSRAFIPQKGFPVFGYPLLLHEGICFGAEFSSKIPRCIRPRNPCKDENHSDQTNHGVRRRSRHGEARDEGNCALVQIKTCDRFLWLF